MSSPTEDPSAGSELSEQTRPPAAGTVTNLITAVVVMALGGAALAGSLSLGVGTLSSPRPGTWPAIVSAVLIVLGAVLAVQARRTSDAERFTRTAFSVLAAVASMVVHVAVISLIGFEIPTALLAFFWLRVLGRESWRISIVLSLAITVAFYLLFVGALQVSIPHLF
ncbi:tripartite tricarboxylate transporter TctB family protein [Nonomuraea sp. PA05]|uniref:tripartite tricarboxylate transporter TctB family protein n=1 Tax=Nonomuraea sp. PA05 TaxID=2604466 RepID=UPI0011D87C6F|nr:tripartite tricarboxylate transporter TctB family protein [Nonomuraea sp. PA05]TYB62221.1 tripartite tricarboxylate transporter TctB family protein [Nonomuraea sp. PA05]